MATLIYLILAFSFGFPTWVQARNVTYDERALVIDGQRKLLISGSIHYPRSTPEMWPDLISKSKDGGVDVIESYVFWNLHEPQRRKYDFDGRLDLIRFIKETQKAGLFFFLRIGPYVCAEWNYGGFPAWLHFIPGIKLRTDNPIFKSEMETFTKKIVDMLKEKKLFYWQGGPVILTQIENEYGNVDEPYGPSGKRYMHWAAEMAVGLETGVPWVMCQQKDAPDSMINTCNGFYCDSFEPKSPNKPKMWTENWTGWFLAFGGLQPHRPVEDIAYAVARFYQRGGTFQNYYMYHGGTNFERTAGGPFIATSYDYDAPIDEYGLLNQPKWGHLKDLHQALKLCEKALLFGEVENISLGPDQEGHVYKTEENECSAFLSNKDHTKDAKVIFSGQMFDLPAWSVSILPDCTHVVFNTAKVKAQTSVINMTPVDSKYIVPSYNQSSLSLIWKSYSEPIGVWGSNAFNITGFGDQMNTTKDITDYLWYTKSVYINNTFTKNSTRPSISVKSLGHNMLIFVNGNLLGNGYGSYSSPNFQLQLPLQLQDGDNNICLLSSTVGLQNYGSFFDTKGAGIDGPVALRNLFGSEMDLSSQTWTYQIGLKGEELKMFSDKEVLNVSWNMEQPPPTYQPMTWYKTTFNSPPGDNPVALDLMGMGKGQAWVNGKGLGRYWLSFLSSNLGCSSKCDYRGVYDSTKCNSNCGQPSQKWYHIPRSWLKPSENLLVLFEEVGGDPTKISFVTRAPGLVCSHVSEVHYSVTNRTQPKMRLQCGPNQTISHFQFVSYGNPEGTCQNFRRGNCHADGSIDVVKKACMGKEWCSMNISAEQFGKDPCPGVLKSLAVQAMCSYVEGKTN